MRGGARGGEASWSVMDAAESWREKENSSKTCLSIVVMECYEGGESQCFTSESCWTLTTLPLRYAKQNFPILANMDKTGGAYRPAPLPVHSSIVNRITIQFLFRTRRK